MTGLLTGGGLGPFLAAAGLVLGLLLLEALFLLVGLSTGIDGADAPDGPDGPAAGGLLGLLGMRGLPLTVWLALLAADFAAVGLLLQMGSLGLRGAMLPVWTAALLAAPAALILAGSLSRLLARLLPRDTTSAISETSLGRRLGEVTVGVARAGRPAQVRVTDQHGNLQYLLAEPLDPADEFREGTRVLVLRVPGGGYRLVGAE